MTRRYRLLTFAIGLAALGFILCLYLLVPSGRFSAKDYNAVAMGMTRLQVEEVIGGPPGNYESGRRLEYTATSDEILWEAAEDRATQVTAFWKGDFGRIAIGFDDEERAASKCFCPSRPVAETWWDRLLGLLRL